jgi:hypothetical protein
MPLYGGMAFGCVSGISRLYRTESSRGIERTGPDNLTKELASTIVFPKIPLHQLRQRRQLIIQRQFEDPLRYLNQVPRSARNSEHRDAGRPRGLALHMNVKAKLVSFGPAMF